MYAKYLRYMLPLVPVLCLMAVGLVFGLELRQNRSAREVWELADGTRSLEDIAKGIDCYGRTFQPG